ncbi:hypothetical protein RFI_15986 [Reticulomyxa filosa]|uniref:Uncharacterized protein n=1 Tax=Reticulomyxa filosa TaxID=46433 RepID=X6N7C7_RETFI|nr:hypothetical protein RFI_15986 [Reticulomyxa filosa]|eukprot:ETO21217.1 hypothetical protein RFI_15986 [Reticulomyxa filosa]
MTVLDVLIEAARELAHLDKLFDDSIAYEAFQSPSASNKQYPSVKTVEPTKAMVTSKTTESKQNSNTEDESNINDHDHDHDNSDNDDIVTQYTRPQHVSTPDRWRVIDARVAEKTKRWASKVKHVPLHENTFHLHVNLFVYPLMDRYIQNYSFLEQFSMLHGRILFTLGCLIECAGPYSPHILRLSKDLFQMLICHFNHPKAEIRRSTYFALAKILSTCPINILLHEEWFMQEWTGIVSDLGNAMKNDPDVPVRDLARHCLVVFDKATKNIQNDDLFI